MQLLLFSFVLKTCFSHPYFSNGLTLGFYPHQKNDLVSDAPKANITHLFGSINFNVKCGFHLMGMKKNMNLV
jgi:hypothetical protein